MKNTHKKITIKKTTQKRYPLTTEKVFAAGSREGQIFAHVPYTSYDFRNALLIVSLSVNVFVLTLWLTTQVSNQYALHVAQYIAR